MPGLPTVSERARLLRITPYDGLLRICRGLLREAGITWSTTLMAVVVSPKTIVIRGVDDAAWSRELRRMRTRRHVAAYRQRERAKRRKAKPDYPA